MKILFAALSVNNKKTLLAFKENNLIKMVLKIFFIAAHIPLTKPAQ